jgi:hypothetical protein
VTALPIEPDKLTGLVQDTLTVPDLSVAVEGWRTWEVAWRLPKYGVAPKMHSVTESHYFWAPRQAMRAVCHKPHCETPGEECSCGFYSARTLDHLLSMNYHVYDPADGRVNVVGKVANWGKVIQCSQGWRSEWAYPVELYVPFEAHHLGRPLREAYGVPVRLLNFLKPGHAGPR